MKVEARPVTELGRFLSLAADRSAKGDDPAQMFSGAVGAAWHALRREPDPYHAFCLAYAGRPVEYVPACGRGLVNWISDYERRFGPVPGVWFTDADGSFREDQWRRYQNTGQVVAEWHGLPRLLVALPGHPRPTAATGPPPPAAAHGTNAARARLGGFAPRPNSRPPA